MVKRIKIVLFADVLEEDFDGVSITLNKILKSVPTERFDFLVITSHPPKNLEDFRHKILLLPYLSIPFQKGYRLGLPSDKKLKKEIDDFNPDLIHFTSPSLFGKYAIKYGRKNNIPVLNIYHTHYPTYFKYYLGKLGIKLFGTLLNNNVMWYYKNSNMTLAPTPTIKNDLINLGVNQEKIRVWGRAIKTDSFSPVYRDEEYFKGKVPKDHKVLLFVSRLIKEKEMSSIVNIYKLLRKENAKASIVITGDGPKRKYLEKNMPTAIFTGKQTSHELSKVYASADLFFFPSVTETFGNVVIEAMASGLPVVAAKAGGPADIVKDNITGFLVEPKNAQAFVEKIMLILNDEDKYQEMSRNAIQHTQPITIESLHNELWHHYEETIKNYNTKTNQ